MNTKKTQQPIKKINMYTKTTTEDVKVMSLYEYLGKAAGSELGKAVYQASIAAKVPVETHEVTTPKYTGKIMRYPKTFLDVYFKNK